MQALSARISTSSSRHRVLVGFAILSVVISAGFYIDARRATFTSLSSDQVNILSIVSKLDFPDRYANDSIVGNSEDIAYYTPFFIGLVRLTSGRAHDYLSGLGILLLATSLIYMWGWFELFSIFGDRLVAAVVAFLARGLIWPPGTEIWGISGIATMLPRTLFIALAPWVLVFWLRLRRTRWLFVPALGAGFLVNVHPISGAGLIGALLCAEGIATLMDTRSLGRTLAKLVLPFAAMLVTAAPYVWTYSTRLGGLGTVNPATLHSAMRTRLPSAVFGPWEYLHAWMIPKWLVFLFTPWVACFALRNRVTSKERQLLIFGGTLLGGFLVAALAPFGVEALLRRLGHEIRFAYQLVRIGKYMLVPTFFIGALVLAIGARWLRSRTAGAPMLAGLSGALVVTTLFSRAPIFDGIPFLGDDTARSLWPSLSGPSQGDPSLDEVIEWVNRETPKDAKLVAPGIVRVATARSIVHDWPGSGLLVEGNPQKFIETWQREIAFNEARRKGDALAVVESWDADYWITKNDFPVQAVFASGKWNVYRLR